MAKQKTSLGCMFWIALVLFILVIFFFNRERIMMVIEETGFTHYLLREEPVEPEVKRVVPVPGETSPPAGENTITIKPDEEDKESTKDISPPEKPETEDKKSATPKDQQEKPKMESGEPFVEKRLRKSAVYFVKIGEDASIELKKIIRPVYYSDSPLTETINVLLEGLTSEELNNGLLNLIPQDTVLNRVWIENGVAYLDFSESIKFNQFGSEGLRAELRQIVYTATEFPTVEAVQILVNGTRLDYLSSEGIYIGKPLTRQNVP
jgi:spore germination protein GerM